MTLNVNMDSTAPAVNPVDPKSKTHIDLSTTVEFDALNSKETHDMFAMLNMAAPEYDPEEEEARLPMEICAVIDRSGSMSGDKLTLVKETLEFVVGQLKPTDALSIVTFESGVRVETPMVNMDAKGKKITEEAIKKIQVAGATNLSGGLFEGLNQIYKHHGLAVEAAPVAQDIPMSRSNVQQRRGPSRMSRLGQMMNPFKSNNNDDVQESETAAAAVPAAAPTTGARVSTVLLCTDGHANGGIQDKNQLVTEIESRLRKYASAPVNIFTFGFGTDHSEELLQAVAQAGGGMYYFVDSPESIPTAFGDCLGGLLSVVAQNISIKISAANGATIEQVMNTRFPMEEVKAKHEYVVKMGDLYSEEERNMLFSIKIPQLQAPSPAYNAFDITYSYFNVITGEKVTQQLQNPINRPASGTKGASHPKLDEHRNRVEVSTALNEARALGDNGKYAEGRTILENMRKKVETSVSAASQLNKELLVDIQNAHDGMEEVSYAMNSKKMMMYSAKHGMQRASHFDSADHCAYQTKSKGRMAAKFKK
eukprot:GFYU01000178.1.p1 GENE.GFYU01000178.1~~GFYU01000178.1.p1  ORF type:complete len:554 (+),score=227.01 GFYU01000178.1:55-1662(+)